MVIWNLEYFTRKYLKLEIIILRTKYLSLRKNIYVYTLSVNLWLNKFLIGRSYLVFKIVVIEDKSQIINFGYNTLNHLLSTPLLYLRVISAFSILINTVQVEWRWSERLRVYTVHRRHSIAVPIPKK